MIWGYPHFKKPPYIPSGKRTVCYWKWTIEIVDVAIKKLFVFIVMLVYQRVMGKFFQMSWYHFFLDIILELDELGAGCSHIYIIYIYIYIYILYLLILRYIKHIFLKWYLKISQRLWVFFFRVRGLRRSVISWLKGNSRCDTSDGPHGVAEGDIGGGNFEGFSQFTLN